MKNIMRVMLPILMLPALAHGWGSDGHHITGRIAEHYLTPKAKDSIKALLGDESLAQVTTWADEIRSNPDYRWAAPLHYVNIAPEADTFDLQRDCPEQGCVVSAIGKYKQVLLNAESTRAEKTEALKFLAHFLGDIHQPLHCSYAADRGGNSIQVRLNGTGTNLHSAWDTGIIGTKNLGWEAYALELLNRITPEQQVEWHASLDPAAWATQMFLLARDKAYKDENGATIVSGAELSPVYVQQSLQLCEVQLEMAGVRMGYFFNEVFEQAPVEIEQPTPAAKEYDGINIR